MKFEAPSKQTHAKSLADKVHELLQHKICSGELKPGQRIPEKEFARRLALSRTPVREALLRLESEGLVTCNSRRSYNVRILSVGDVKDIYRTLSILEAAVARQAAPHITSSDIRLLRKYNQQMEQAAKSGNLQTFGRRNREFHEVFVSKLENRVLCEVCDSVRTSLYTFPVRRSSLMEWLKKSVREHREIIRLVKAGDAKRVESYFRDVHWSYEKNRRYIKDAFDYNGDAVLPV